MSDSSILFEALAARPRRRVLVLLLDSDSVEVPDALGTRSATQVADGREDDATRARSEHSAVSQTEAVALYHQHLPKLEEYGFIDWDRDAGTVSRGPKYGAVEPALQVLVSHATQFPPDLV